MTSLPPRIVNMARSGIREIMDLAALRPDAVHLEVGQPDFPTPAHIVEAGIKAAVDGYTTYTPNRGLLEVRETIVEKLERDNGIRTTVDDVAITCGAVNALFECIASLVSPGDSILLPDPGWPNYVMMAETLGAQAVHYPLVAEEGYLPDLDRLAELVHSTGARVVVINSPSNPTGAVFPRQMIERLVELAEEYDFYLISDECYEHIVFDGEHVSPASLDDRRVLSVFSLSKSYAMTGWRVGYVCGPPAVMQLVAKVQEPIVSCATAIAQKAAQAALAGDQACVREMTATYARRRDTVADLLSSADMLINRPQGAFYILADIAASATPSDDFARRLVTSHGVAVAPGLTFGPSGNDVVRISLAAADDHLRAGIDGLVQAVHDVNTRATLERVSL